MTGSILVVDKKESLVRTLGKAAPRLRSQMTACHQTAQAAKEVAKGHAQVLVAGPSCLTQAGIRFLQRAHKERPELIILLLTDTDTPEIAPRDLVRIGASDMVRYPAAAKTLRSALEGAVEMAHATGSRVEQDAAFGTALTVTSPTGGCGKTFFATNLAYEIAVHSGKRVALIDLDLQFGEVNTALRLRPDYTIFDLLDGNDVDSETLRSQLPEFMDRHASGIDVLAAPGDPSEADYISSPDITRVVQAAKELYHYVVIDTPTGVDEAVLAAFDLSDALMVLATLDLPSIKNLGVFLSTLDRLKIPQDGVSLILNKAESDVGLSPAEVQRLFDQDFRGVLPYAKEVSRSFNTGRPILETSRNSAIGRSLARTVRAVLPDEATLDAAPPPEIQTVPHRGGLARFFGRLARA